MLYMVLTVMYAAFLEREGREKAGRRRARPEAGLSSVEDKDSDTMVIGIIESRGRGPDEPLAYHTATERRTDEDSEQERKKE